MAPLMIHPQTSFGDLELYFNRWIDVAQLTVYFLESLDISVQDLRRYHVAKC
jgi:hypothetical protein